MCSLICVWINSWVNNREAGDLRRYRAHYDVTVMFNWYTRLNFQLSVRDMILLLHPSYVTVCHVPCRFCWRHRAFAWKFNYITFFLYHLNICMAFSVIDAKWLINSIYMNMSVLLHRGKEFRPWYMFTAGIFIWHIYPCFQECVTVISEIACTLWWQRANTIVLQRFW